MELNRADLRQVNNFNQTAVFHATQARKDAFAWKDDLAQILDYEQIATKNKTVLDPDLK